MPTTQELFTAPKTRWALHLGVTQLMEAKPTTQKPLFKVLLYHLHDGCNWLLRILMFLLRKPANELCNNPISGLQLVQGTPYYLVAKGRRGSKMSFFWEIKEHHSEEVQVAFIYCDSWINPKYSAKPVRYFLAHWNFVRRQYYCVDCLSQIVLQLGFVWSQGVWAGWLINYWRGDFSVFISQSTLPWACLSIWHKRCLQSAQFQRLQTSRSMII